MPPKKRDVKAAAKADQTADKVSKKDIKTVSTSATGGVFVDHMVPQAVNYSVVNGADGKPLSCYLMWSDIKDNHNKYYIAQGLQDKSGSHYLWTRYGRVGLDGVGDKAGCCNLDMLLKLYNKKYHEKTRKGYTEVKMALGTPNQGVKAEIKTGAKEEKKKKDDGPKSKLDQRVQDLISFIFDMNLIEQSVIQIGYDVKRLPLGQLSKETVLEGYKYLTEIEKVLNGKSKGDLADLSAKFYTYIPHNFGMKHMSNFIIKSHESLKQKLDLIQNLIDIKIAHKIMNPKAAKKAKNAKNPLDEKYDALNCNLVPLDERTEERKMVEIYLENTKESRKMQVIELFKVERDGEDKRFNPNKLSNKKLLWHGSRFSNFGGILS